MFSALITLRTGRDEAGKKSILMVSLSTVRPGVPHDPTCFVYPGDHAFVKRKSYVVYPKARLEAVEAVSRGVENGLLVPRDPMDSGVFARICKGLEDSAQTPPKLLAFYRQATGWS